jgi:hypothetical protein
MKRDTGIECIDFLSGANTYKSHTFEEPKPPEGFIDSTVRLGRLQPDGSIEWYGTQEPFPPGWNSPKSQKGEDTMNKPREDKAEKLQEVKRLMKDGMSMNQASIQVGVPVGTIGTWLKREEQTPIPAPAQAANQEPEREEAEPAGNSVAQEEPLAQREQGFGPEDEESIPYQVVGKYEALGKAIGALVDEKNLQYGDAFNRGGCILEILYPDGVKPEQYRDMLGVIRVIDKLFRVANGKQGNEDPWQDIAGYGLLGTGE